MPRNLDRPPPRALYRAIIALRSWLQRLLARMVPARVALFEMLKGVWITQMLVAAAKLGIADALSEGAMTCEALAVKIGAHPQALSRLLRALTSQGVFERDGQGRYRLNRLAMPLMSSRPDSMRDILMFLGSEHSMQAWARFPDVVKTNTNGYRLLHQRGFFEYLAAHPLDAEVFHRGMVNMTELDAPAVVFGLDFARFSRVCDVGGGRGTMLAALLRTHPAMQGVLLDDAAVVSDAESILGEWGVRDRCTIVAGDFFSEVPAGCDAYLLKDILHDWDDDKVSKILRAVRRAARPGAVILIVEMVLVDDEEPHLAKLLDLEMLDVTEGGRQRTAEELGALLAATGFALKRVHPLASPVSVVEGVAVAEAPLQ